MTKLILFFKSIYLPLVILLAFIIYLNIRINLIN